MAANKTTTVTWRFKPALVKAIRELAAKERRSINAQAELVLEAGLRAGEVRTALAP